MHDPRLSSQMFQVIDALSSGANLTEAAAAAGVHRNTVAYWRRNFPRFRQALADAQSDRALIFRERAEALADVAFNSLHEVLTTPEASPSVRLRAAIFIIRTAMATTPPKADQPISLNEILNVPLGSHVSADPEQPEEECAEPEPAQECTTANMHNDAQKSEPYVRTGAKIGRNDPCPCGSGHKYKHCCLDKPEAAA